MVESRFFFKAETFLRTNVDTIVREFLLESPQGKWHPNGFAVFHLREIAGLGRLRLHIWPQGRRIALEGQPAIHSHPWDLCSLVIAGCYQDTVYLIKQSSELAGHLRGFRVQFGAPAEGDRVCPLQERYELTVVEERKVHQGSMHQVVAGALHETLVPADEFVSTLLVTTEEVDLCKLLLIGDNNFPEQTYLRPSVSDEDVAQMKADLITHLSKRLLR